MTHRKRLSDIVSGGSSLDDLHRLWQTTEAAGELAPLPRGEYLCRVLSGELFNARTGTPGYKVALQVAEGEHAGRRLWLDFWLTRDAMPIVKRDLLKLGVTDVGQLDQPLPAGRRLRCHVVLRTNDAGAVFNEVTRIEAAGVEPADPFALPPNADVAPAPEAAGSVTPAVTSDGPRQGDAAEESGPVLLSSRGRPRRSRGDQAPGESGPYGTGY